jgi:hypothetical protein
MTLVPGGEAQAIFGNASFGPIFGGIGGGIFGGAYDIYIADKCNMNNKSGTDFPFSYNYGSKYQKGQHQSWTALCGALSGKQFKVVEYEVFQVIK